MKKTFDTKEYENALNEFFYIDRLHHRIVDGSIKKMGIHRNQHFMLMHIADSPEPGFQKQIANELQISTAAVANTLNSLEKSGYITRETDSDDTRKNIITITEKGRSIVDASRAKVEAVNKAMFRGLDRERLRAFRECLEIIKNNLKEEELSCEASEDKEGRESSEKMV